MKPVITTEQEIERYDVAASRVIRASRSPNFDTKPFARRGRARDAINRIWRNCILLGRQKKHIFHNPGPAYASLSTSSHSSISA